MNQSEQTLSKIHIMGAAGSGKTTLASKVAERLGTPCFELDAVAYEGGYARKRTLAERAESLKEITQQPTWVTEGAFIWWIDDLLDAADTIVWLDLPWYVSMPRIVTRHVKLSMAGTNKHPGLGNLVRFTWGCRLYYLEPEPRQPKALDDDTALNRAGAVKYLNPYVDKVIQCQKPKDVELFLAQLQGKESI